MKLNYRGVEYDYTPPVVNTKDTDVVGHYRGVAYEMKQTEPVAVNHNEYDLTYRGVAYHVGGNGADRVATNEVETAPAVPANALTSIEDMARGLMMSHHNWVKNREQSLVARAAAEVGLEDGAGRYWSQIQGKINPGFRASYDRSRAAFS